MDAAEPASGHELRFLDKLEDAGLVEKKTVRLNWRRITLAVSVAAAIIVGFVLIKPAEEIALVKHTDWFANAESTPEGVYEAYYNQFQKDCQEVSAYDGEDVIEDITTENGVTTYKLKETEYDEFKYENFKTNHTGSCFVCNVCARYLCSQRDQQAHI